MLRTGSRLAPYFTLAALVLLLAPPARAQSFDPRGAAFAALRNASSVPLTGSTEAGAIRLVSFNVPAFGSSPVDQARSFLNTYGPLFGQTGFDISFVVRRVETNPGPSQIVAFGQQYKGVPIHGGGIRIELENAGPGGGARVVSAHGAVLPDLGVEGGLDVIPSFPPGPCVVSAASHLARPGATALADPKLMIYDPRLAGGSADPHLVWAATMGGGSPVQVFCDAHSGAIVFERPFANEALDLWEGLQFPNPQHIFLGDESGLGATGQGILDAVVEWNYAHQIYDFFTNTFGWRGTAGWDNQLQLLVHSNTTQFYHDPFGENLDVQTGWASLDVTAHEYGHGIIHHSSDLDYSKISGALNEGYADAMGMFIDNQDWLLAEDRTQPPGNGWYLRNFADPPKASQPDQYSELCTSNNQCDYDGDNGGVHTNSGILNKAHYLMAAGDAFNGRPAFAGVAMGRFRMGVLAYEVMTSLTSSATFQDARARSIAVAQLYANHGWRGFIQSDVCAVRDAFAAVEIGPGDFNCDGVEDNFQDPDGDFVPSSIDNCPIVWNPDQKNFDNDGIGDACDTDFDNDGRPNGSDNCFANPNWDQANNDKFASAPCGADGLGDVCDADDDNDGVLDQFDNCPKDCNPGQQDGNGINGGDACDPDTDGDGHYESSGDNCPCVYNPSQSDGDGDGIGDTCDLCPAHFDVPNAYYGATWLCNAPTPVQADSDDDGIGDACDATGFGEVSLDLFGSPFIAGQLGSPGSAPAFFSLRGPGGNSFRIPVPLCNTSAAGGQAPALVELLFNGLAPEVNVALLDDDGLAIDSIRPGGAGSLARGLRVDPDCSRNYLLEFTLSAAFGGASEFMLMSSLPDPTSANPYVTPGMGLPPAPPIPDMDRDGLLDFLDSCPTAYDPTGADSDGDGVGDVCDSCTASGAEVCNGLDDDCDGTVDNAANPGPVQGVALNPQPFPPAPGTLMSWSADPSAQSYDVVYGLLSPLRNAAGGGFTAATRGCLGDNINGTSVQLNPQPFPPGEGFWFLVRGNNCGGHGSYDSADPAQVGSRDAGISGSPLACP